MLDDKKKLRQLSTDYACVCGCFPVACLRAIDASTHHCCGVCAYSLDDIAVVQQEVGSGMATAVAAGLKARKKIKRRRVQEEAKQSAAFLPVDSTGTRRGLRWDTSAWLVGLADDQVTVEYSDDHSIAEVEGQADFGTARVAGMALGAGAWYYEVTLVSNGVMQIGWADGRFEGSSDMGDGVGDHVHSWAFDGARAQKWNGDSADYGQEWAAGDVVGCYVDTQRDVFRFTLNGTDMGVAFEGVALGPASSGGTGLFPALSLEAGEVAQVNVGRAPFKYMPPLGALPVTAGRIAGAPPAVKGSGSGSGSGQGGSGAATMQPAPIAVASDQPQPDEPPTPRQQSPIATQQPPKMPEPAPEPAPQPNIVLSGVKSAAELEKHGLDALKHELQARGLKCGCVACALLPTTLPYVCAVAEEAFHNEHNGFLPSRGCEQRSTLLNYVPRSGQACQHPEHSVAWRPLSASISNVHLPPRAGKVL